MPLNELVSVIEKLKNRIDQHGFLLRQSEALTRYVLIDPLLRELGWDTGDPDMVRPQYRDAGGYADYALMGNGGPVALVEAKKLGAPLASGIEQVLNYCNQQGITYMVVTDGDRWEMYEVFRQARIEDSKLTTISIRRDVAVQVAVKSLHLWKASFWSGTSTTTPGKGSEQIPTTLGKAGATNGSGDVTESTPVGSSFEQSAVPWKAINHVHPTTGDKAPSAIRFSRGKEKQIRYWKDVTVEVAEWLIRIGALTAQKCPISRTHGRHIVHSKHQHPTGREFPNPHTLSNGLFLAAGAPARKAVDDAIKVTEYLGHDASEIELRLV